MSGISVLFLIRSLRSGGAERQLALLASALKRAGHNVEVVTFYGGGVYERKLLEDGIAVTCLCKGGRWDLLIFSWKLIRFVRARRPDVFYSYMSAANILAILSRPFIGQVELVWGLRTSDLDTALYDRAVALSIRLEALLSRWVDLIIANSHAGREHAIAASFPPSKTIVIPNGIDTDEFKPDAEARRRFRARLGIEERERLVGLVGRLDPIKNHQTFIDAAALVHRGTASVRFVCVGGGPENYASFLKKKTDSVGLSGYLLWAGQLQDMNEVYNGIDVLCLASSSEGFPNVVAEAMACGTSCVVTDVGDAARIVGPTGKIVPAGEAPALAEAIQLSLASAVDRRILRERIVKSFSVDSLRKKTAQAFQRLLIGKT